MNTVLESDIKRALYILIAITTAIRIFIAATLEFSVDEVYYWTYALYPDWSHFDHPPMVGFIIQLFSLNLFFDGELAIRLGAIVISMANTFIIYSIGKNLPTGKNHEKNPLIGLYAAFLLNASIYCSVLAGNFIIPDTPQLLFWLLSLKYVLKSLPEKSIKEQESKNFLIASLFAGLAILSKYHGVFIWGGIGLYVLFYNRNWLKVPSFYVGGLISVLFTLPIIIWNIQNNWISFNFHGDRVVSDFSIRFDYFFREIFGQIAYHNPINYVVIALALIAIIKGWKSMPLAYLRILLLNSIPIWIVFSSFALFRQTLPHWSGPAFTALLLFAASYIYEKTKDLNVSKAKVLFPKIIRSSIFLLYGLLTLAWVLIQFYPGTIGNKEDISKYGDMDFTLDMYGWKQIKTGFEEVVKNDVAQRSMPLDAPILSPKYFPGTEIDYYVARPLGKKVLQYGTFQDIHKYAWINKSRGELQLGEDAYMISTSNWYKDPDQYYGDYFSEIIPIDTIEIMRSGRLAYYAFVYQLLDYKGEYPDPLNNN